MSGSRLNNKTDDIMPTIERRALIRCGAAVLIAAALLPFDGAISSLLTAWRPGGDLRREAELIQQFGSPTTILLCALIIWRLDPLRLPRMLDWLLAAGMTWLSVFALKITLGRPRPKFVGEHLHFLGPWNTHVVKEGDPPRHAWEVFADDVAEIWSMPSSHTAFAVVAAICLTHLYPRLRPVAFGLAAIVGFCRVLLKAHYASDVLIGAAMGYLLAEVCMTGMLGQRLAGRFKTPRRD